MEKYVNVNIIYPVYTNCNSAKAKKSRMPRVMNGTFYLFCYHFKKHILKNIPRQDASHAELMY
jgi:hypothetical protein